MEFEELLRKKLEEFQAQFLNETNSEAFINVARSYEGQLKTPALIYSICILSSSWSETALCADKQGRINHKADQAEKVPRAYEEKVAYEGQIKIPYE
jgi:hypothetical protein